MTKMTPKAALKQKTPQSKKKTPIPQMEIDSEDSDNVETLKAVKKQTKKAVKEAPKKSKAQPVKVPDDDDEDDDDEDDEESEDEVPNMKGDADEDDDDDEEDDEDEAETVKKTKKDAKTVGKAAKPAKPAEDSEDDDEDDDDEEDDDDDEDDDDVKLNGSGQKRKHEASLDSSPKKPRNEKVLLWLTGFENYVEKYLRQQFTKKGVELATDLNLPKKFSVRVADPDDYEKALGIGSLNCDGINVSVAAPPAGQSPPSFGGQGAGQSASNTMFVKGLSDSTTSEQLTDLFSASSVRMPTFPDTGRMKGFAFVELDSSDAVDKAIKTMQGCELDGRSLFLDHSGGGRGGGGGGGGGRGGGGRGGPRGGGGFRGTPRGGGRGRGGFQRGRGRGGY